MTINKNTAIIFYLIPTILEILGWIITIPFFPLSFGSLIFSLIGIIQLQKLSWPLKNNFFISFLIIFIGFLFASIFSNDFFDNFFAAVGLLVLLLGSAGISTLWQKEYFIKTINSIFILLFLKYSIYVYYNTLKNFELESYTSLYNKGLVVNHHLPGLMISISSLFLYTKLTLSPKKNHLLSVIVILSSILCCFLLETRSNLIFTIVGIFLVQIKVIKLTFKTLLWSILLCVGVNIAISTLFDTSERLRQRFDIQDTAYQSETTASRLYVYTAFINVIQQHPFGTGYREAYLPGITSKKLFLHNSYLTYILGGGIFSFVGVLLLLKELLNFTINFIRTRKLVSDLKNNLESISLSFIIYFLTLVSIELGGLFFFFILSLGIYCSKINDEKS